MLRKRERRKGTQDYGCKWQSCHVRCHFSFLFHWPCMSLCPSFYFFLIVATQCDTNWEPLILLLGPGRSVQCVTLLCNFWHSQSTSSPHTQQRNKVPHLKLSVETKCFPSPHRRHKCKPAQPQAKMWSWFTSVLSELRLRIFSWELNTFCRNSHHKNTEIGTDK